jgi:hypothetical protein
MAKCPEGLLYGAQMSKTTRQEVFGEASGGAKTTDMEKYQRKAVEDGTGLACQKTNYRINSRKNTLEYVAHPLHQVNGFDYTEDFDGVQNAPFGRVFISFKSVVGAGGSQTRTLRECYHFAEAQLKLLLKLNKEMFFANILDGDEAEKRMKNFTFLCSLPEYASVAHNVYVGHLGGYFDWFNKCATKE